MSEVPNDDFQSREEIVAYEIDRRYRKEYNIVSSPIDALNLGVGMVLKVDGKLTIVTAVRYENRQEVPTVVLETSAGLETFASDAQAVVWFMNGKPFLMPALPEDVLSALTFNGQDAGVSPARRAPKRFN
jgi:hypothetical protein